MPFIWRNTEYTEPHDGSTPKESFGPNEGRASRVVWVDWLTRGQAAVDFMGHTTREVYQAGHPVPYIHREVPMDHPDYPLYLWCEAVTDLEGRVPEGRSPGEVAAFDKGRMTLSFTTRKYMIRTDAEMIALQAGSPAYPDESTLLRYMTITETPRPRSQALPPNSALKWVGPPPQVPMSTSTPIILHESDISIVWEQIPLSCYNRAAIDATIGKTNRRPFGHAFCRLGVRQPRTLVMGAPGIEPINCPDGQEGVRLTLKYRYYPQTVDQFFRFDVPVGERPGFRLATRNGLADGPRLLEETDYETMFFPP